MVFYRLICRYSISIDFNAAKVIRASAAGIAGAALNGVDLSISHASTMPTWSHSPSGSQSKKMMSPGWGV